MSKIKLSPEFSKAYKMLNKEQKLAVDSIEGPVMVIAGPGTGKTQILTLRIANILRLTDTPADAILALTFTESAAANMKKRLVSLVGPEGYKVRIHTFHGFANSIIQDNPDAFPRFIGASPVSDIDRLLLVSEILDENSEKFSELTPFFDRHSYLKDILGAISTLKRDAVSAEDLSDFTEKEEKNFFAKEDIYNKKTGTLKREWASYEKKLKRSGELALLYEIYEQKLQEKRLYDFEDMILELLRALQDDEDFKLQVQEQFLYVLADEHQDANDAQNALLESLSDFHESPNLFIVGDEKQAIYRFQGASLQNFLYFKDKFKNTLVINLKDSYRSGQKILDVSHSLIRHSSEQGLKREKLRSKANIKNAKVELSVYANDENEALLIAKKIRKLIDEGVDPNEIAVIYRTNADAEIFAKALAKEGVAFNIESDSSALDDKEIKKLLVLLHSIADYGNDEKLTAALHLDFIDLDELDIYKVIKAFRRKKKVSLHELLDKKKNLCNLNLNDYKKIYFLAKKLKKYAKLAKQEPLSELISKIMEDFGFLGFALALPNSLDILEKLRALLKDAELMSQGKKEYFLSDFLEHIELLQKHKLSIRKSGDLRSGSKVRLYTAHKSKGLEFEYVFLTKAYDGKWGSRRKMEKFILPVKNTSQDEEDNDERRLFFVAITRAKLAVFISYGYLSDSGKERLPSRFISEIDQELLSIKSPKREEEKIDPLVKLSSKKDKKSIFDLDFLRALLLEHGLSITAINNFKSCPWNYFYSNLIRIPKMQTKYMLLGNAVHLALYLLHEDANKGQVERFQKYESAIDEFLYARSSSEIVYKDTKKLASVYFKDWFETYKNELGKFKTLNEYRIETELELNLDEPRKIKLTGILDKIELLDGKLARVVDYKTGKAQTRNKILGKTSSEGSGDYFRQLLFYKLLLELEGQYEMKEGALDFVQRKDNGQMIREQFDMSSENTSEIKDIIEDTVKSIWNFDFWDFRCDKYKKGTCEYCKLRDYIDN